METSQLLEAFDENNQWPTVDLNPKMKPAQVFQLITTDVDSPIVVKFAGTSTMGEKITKLTKADKSLQIVLFSLSPKGNFAELKNGLGEDPMTTISTIIQLTKEITKTQQIDSIMLRYPAKKMKGRGPQLQRIFKAIARRFLPSFTTLDEISEFDGGKHGYVVLYKKAKGIDNSGLPEPDEKRFTKVDTSVGEKFIDDTTGKSVSKPEAIAVTIADNSAKQTDKEIMMKTRISRRALIQAQGQLIGEPDFPVSSASLRTADEFDTTAVPESSEGAQTVLGINAIFDVKTKPVELSPVSVSTYIENATKLNLIALTSQYGYSHALLWDEVKNNVSDPNEVVKLNTFLNSYNQAKANIDPNNVNETLAKVIGDLRKLNYPNPEKFADIARKVAGELCLVVSRRVSTYAPTAMPDMRPQDIKAIKDYTGSGYKYLNNALLGLDSFPKTIQTKVKALDSAISVSGAKLDKSVILYRLQRVNRQESIRLLTNKVFYFRNFVSTSLKPLIYDSMVFGESAAGTVSGPELSQSDLSPEEFVTSTQQTTDNDIRDNLTYAFIIKGASKIKSLVTGAYSSWPAEAEVILPRGTTLKINKVYGKDRSIDVDSSDFRTFLLDSEVMDPELLDESVDVYDGDLFMSEGIIKPLVKTRLFDRIYENVDKASDEDWDILASVINIDVPEKFID